MAAKGATPIHNEFMPDTDGVQNVPLYMAEPVLFVKGERNANNRGFPLTVLAAIWVVPGTKSSWQSVQMKKYSKPNHKVRCAFLYG